MQNSSRPCAQHGRIWRIGGPGINPEIVTGDWSASRPRCFDPFPLYTPQLNWRLGGPQWRSGLCRDEKNYAAPLRKRTSIPLLSNTQPRRYADWAIPVRVFRSGERKQLSKVKTVMLRTTLRFVVTARRIFSLHCLEMSNLLRSFEKYVGTDSKGDRVGPKENMTDVQESLY